MKQLLITIAAVVLVGCGEKTPNIWVAARDGNLEIVKKHIINGVDINAKDNEGDAPLHTAVAMGEEEIVKYLITNGASLNIKDNIGRTSLHWAAFGGSKEITELLIAKGADVNAKTFNKTGISGVIPLHYAAYKGHKEIAELLIAKGADVNAKDDTGETPLDVTFHSNSTTTADLLRKHGGKTSEELKAEGN